MTSVQMALLGFPQEFEQIAIAVCAIIIVVVVQLVRRFRPGRPPGMQQSHAAFVKPTHPLIQPPTNIVTMPESPIEAVRALMGPAPRSFPGPLKAYLSVQAPHWLQKRPDDEDWISLHNQDRLRRDAPVVWGTAVQANSLLFRQSGAETGASVIYSPDRWFDFNRNQLARIASECYKLKGTNPTDPEEAAFARMLTSEVTRAMRLKAPRTITGGREVYHSSMLMPRKHLPKGTLSGTFFPLWMDTQLTGAVVMVPAAYWPGTLLAEWDQS